MFYNNYKWNITFKNCKSLYCTPVTYIVLHIILQLKKKEEEEKEVREAISHGVL